MKPEDRIRSDLEKLRALQPDLTREHALTFFRKFHPAYSEAATTAVMKEQDIPVKVDIGLGNGRATVWTCDLTKEYVAINGDYRS